MNTKKYTIGFGTTSTGEDGSVIVTPINSLPTMDSATYLQFSNQLSYFNHHRPNVTQCTGEQGIYFLFPVPPITDLDMIQSIAKDVMDDDTIKTLIDLFGNNLQGLPERAPNLRLYVRIHHPKAA